MTFPFKIGTRAVRVFTGVAARRESGSSQVKGPRPRVQEASRNGLTSRADKLIGRFLNWASPRGVRVDSKIKAGRDATDAQVMKLLNTFSVCQQMEHEGHRIGLQGDREAIIRLMDKLPSTMKPMTSRAVGDNPFRASVEAGEKEFQTSVERDLKLMSQDDFEGLKKGMADIDALVPAESPLRDRAEVIQKAVTREVTRRLNKAVEDNLAYSMRQEPSLAPYAADNGISISKDFWLELNRADFTVNGSQLIDKTQPADDMDTLRLEALGQLMQSTGANKAQLMALSNVAHQGAMGFIAQPGFAANSPLRLPDGTSCMPMDRGSKLSFDIRGDGKGGLRVSCESKMNLTHLLTPDGRQVTLEKGAQASFKYEVSITPEGKATVTQPLQTECSAKPDEWSAMHNKAYPRPTSAGDLFGPNAVAALRIDMRRFVSEVQFTPENFLFLEELRDMDQSNPAQAQELSNKYFKEGAYYQLNLSSDDAEEVRVNIAKWDKLSPVERAAVIDKTRNTVENLIWTNSAPFLAEPNKVS